MSGYVLVTGGAGYIGSHIAKALRYRGYIPIVLDNLVNGQKDFVKWGPLVIGDVGDPLLLRSIFTQYSPVAVIHCAALIEISQSMVNPQQYYQQHVVATLHLLEEMARFGIKKFIFSSTCAVYGMASSSLISEDMIPMPINPYGRSKWMVEQIIDDMAKAHPFSYVILRFFNVAGADRETEIGEKRKKETHLLPLLVDVALGKHKEIDLYGIDYLTEDGSAVRDFVHVSDIAEGHIKALESLDHQSALTINLGSGTGTSVKQMIRCVEQILQTKIPIIEKDKRVGDAAHLVADIKKAERILKWMPQHSLEEIVRSTWEWKKNHDKS